jgi:hypothetical protein
MPVNNGCLPIMYYTPCWGWNDSLCIIGYAPKPILGLSGSSALPQGVEWIVFSNQEIQAYFIPMELPMRLLVSLPAYPALKSR